MRRLIMLTVLVILLGASAAQAQVAMTQWVEPNERAFSCQVPQGWRVQGGLRRVSAIDVRLDLLVTSPDGQALCRIGDSFIQPMVQPNQFMISHGFQEGRQYSPGYGMVYLVLRYLPGASYLVNFYLPNRVGQVSNLKAANLPVLSQFSSLAMARAGLQMREDAGIITFNMNSQGGPRVGWAFCQTRYWTTVQNASGLANWEVRHFYGYLASPAAETTARRALAAMVKSFQWNQQWVAQQSRAAGQVATIIHQTDQFTNKVIQDVIAHRMKVADKAHDEWVRYIRGTTLRRDPTTGKIREVEDRGTKYYLDQYGRVIPGDRVDDNKALLEGYQVMEKVR